MKLKDTGISLNHEPRYYYDEKKQYEGITTILKEMVFPEMYQNVPEHILKNAAERGSRIHSEIESYDMFGTYESEEVGWYAQSIQRYGFEVAETEYIVTDLERFASPIDKVLTRDGKVYLGDIKTTYKLDTEYLRWQLTFLKFMFNLVNPEVEVEGLLGIWIDRKNERCEILDIEPVVDFGAFYTALMVGEYWESPYKLSIKTDDNAQALALIENLAEVAEQIEFYKDLEKKYKEGITALFEGAGVDKMWETDRFIITKTKDYERSGLDSKLLEKEQPEIFEKYKKIIHVKGSIKTKLK